MTRYLLKLKNSNKPRRMSIRQLRIYPMRVINLIIDRFRESVAHDSSPLNSNRNIRLRQLLSPRLNGGQENGHVITLFYTVCIMNIRELLLIYMFVLSRQIAENAQSVIANYFNHSNQTDLYGLFFFILVGNYS